METKPIESTIQPGTSTDFQVPLNAISTPTLVLTRDYIMVAANEARLRVTNSKREDILGRSVFDAFPDNPNDAEAEGVRNLRTSLDRVLRDKVPDTMAVQKYDIPIPGSNMEEFEVRYWNPINIPILDANGEVTHILHQVEDVTDVMLGKDRLERMSSEIYTRTNEVRSANAALKIAKEDLEIKVVERTAALTASENRFRVIANAMPQIVWTANGTGDFSWYNDWWYEYSGATPGGACNKDDGYMHPDDTESCTVLWQHSLATGHDFQAEFRLKRKSDGAFRWHLGRAVPVHDANKNVIQWVGSYTDIEDQKALQKQFAKAKQAAEQSREEIHSFFMQAPVAIVMLTGPEHIITLANPLSEKYLGEQVTGKPIDRVLTKSAQEIFLPQLDKVYRTGKAYTGKELPLEFPGSNGIAENHFMTVGYHPFRDETAEIKGIFAVLIDETDQVKSRRKIEESESDLRELADAMPQLVIVSSADGNVIYTNQRAQHYFGIESEEIEKWQFEPEIFFHPDDQARAVSSWRESVRLGTTHEIEYRIRRFDGEYRWHLGRAVPVRDERGRITKWYATNTDIHEQKLLAGQLIEARRAAESANATKSEFLANMSHEIRTPLAAIIGFSEILREGEVSPDEKVQYLDTVIRSGKGLTRIIDDILDLAKVEAGKMDVEEIEFSLVTFMQQVLDLFRDKCRQKGIYLLLNIDKDVPKKVISDPTRLRQILINIIGNALKFTTKGGVEVNVTSGRRENGHAELNFRIKDTGIGMTAAQIEKIFKPFVQADNSTTREYGGTGLGLVLSRRLADALGGHIVIADSEEGQGCTFILSLWSAVPDESPLPYGEPEIFTLNGTPLKSERLANLRILVADDSTDNQFLVSRILRKHGALVEVANDGEEAIRKALDSEFDLVLMDIQMPRVNGYEATKALRLNGYVNPVVALTAHAMAEERARTQDAGCSGHLTKPINQKELIDTIEQLVSHN